MYLDHSTIVRSSQAHRRRIKAVLRKCVELTYEGGALGMVADGVDRKRVGANVRRGRALPWEDLEAVMKRLGEMVKELFGKREDEEDGAERRGCPFPEALSDEAGTGHVSFVDGDARMMKIGERIEL